ncbi:HepT-like ribonuclease domain-containing protein [Methanoregula boonei]|jgi:uncharacterized protein with HEPN domain|uniref:HepT-like ribonuclease domain-containing protein n=1 Tax=Methanoregula boonei TaxID=358766 RepID=UPI0012FB1FBD|nr:HepT-like ribonuclease domain-containing protein [Methanoregula boonei]
MRDSGIYLTDILDAMEKIGLFLQDMSYEQFSSDEKTISAVRDKMIIIGEVGK